MGGARRPYCNRHYDSGSKTIFLTKASVENKSSRKLSHFRKYHCNFRKGISSKMVGKADCERDPHPHPPSFFHNLYATQKEREIKANNRSVCLKQNAGIREIQNGNGGSHITNNSGDLMGMFGRYRRCLLPRSYKLGIPQILSFQDKEPDICISIPSIWSFSSPMGIYKSIKTCKGQTSFTSYHYFQLHRRLYPFCRLTRNTFKKHSGCSQSPSEIRVQNQLGEVPVDANSEYRISWGGLGFEKQDLSSTRIKDFRNFKTMQGYCFEKYVVEKNVRATDGEVGLRSSLHSAGQAVSVTTADLDEPTHWDSDEGCPCSFGRSIQIQIGNLEEQGVPESPGSFCGGTAEFDSDDGCFAGGLVRCPASPEGDGVLGSGRGSPFHQLEGDDGSAAYIEKTQVSVVRTLCQTTLGQHDHSLLSEEIGFSATRTPTQPDNGDLGILQRARHSSCSGTPSRGEKRSGRPGLQDESSEYGMEIGCGVFQVDSEGLSKDGDRPICNTDKCSVTQVHVPVSRPCSSRLQCLEQGLERVEVHLPVPSNQHPRRSPTQAGRFPRVGGPNCSLLANSELVPQVEDEVSERSFSPSRESSPESMDFEGFEDRHQQGFLEPSRLATVISFLPVGCSEDTKKILRGAHSEGTIRQYQGTWAKFLKFLDDNHISHNNVSMGVVMNFLSYCACTLGLQYRTITTYKCSLEIPLKSIFNLSFDDTLFRLFMKGIFNIRPPIRAKPGPSWVLDILLSFLSSSRFEPLGGKSIEIKSKKLLCLLLLGTGRRIGEISNLSMKHAFIHGGNALQFFCLKDFTPKHFTEKFIPKQPVIEGLELNPGEDDNLCPLRAFNMYINSVNPNGRCTRDQKLWVYKCSQLSKLFIKCVKDALTFAHVPCEGDIGPHQMRKLAASYSHTMVLRDPLLEAKMQERMGCMTSKILLKNYIHEVPLLYTKCVLPVGTYYPTD